jgi:hypothetical protein
VKDDIAAEGVARRAGALSASIARHNMLGAAGRANPFASRTKQRSARFVQSPDDGGRRRTDRVGRWRDGNVVPRRAAAFPAAERNRRGIIGETTLTARNGRCSYQSINRFSGTGKMGS